MLGLKVCTTRPSGFLIFFKINILKLHIIVFSMIFSYICNIYLYIYMYVFWSSITLSCPPPNPTSPFLFSTSFPFISMSCLVTQCRLHFLKRGWFGDFLDIFKTTGSSCFYISLAFAGVGLWAGGLEYLSQLSKPFSWWNGFSRRVQLKGGCGIGLRDYLEVKWCRTCELLNMASGLFIVDGRVSVGIN